MNKIEAEKCCSTNTIPTYIDLPNKEKGSLPVVIIGAGPVGLAAATHLAKAGERFLVLESGTRVGNHILQWGHVRLFSPWQYNVDKVARELLEKNGWDAPSPNELPTGKQLVEEYLEKIASLPEIQPHIHLTSKVLSISKKGLDKMKSANRENVPFILYVDQNGISEKIEAKAVIDATGTWGQPNPVNADGVWTKEEIAVQSHIYYGIPNINGKDREKYLAKRVAVIGGGHSAINTILELSQLNERNSNEIIWILRKNKVEGAYGGEENDALQARGELGLKVHQLVRSGRVKVYTPYQVQKVLIEEGSLTISGEFKGERLAIDGVDEVIVNTGSRPDFSFLNEIRLRIDSATESVEALAPLIDPNLHSCGTVRPHGEEELRQPEKDFYIAGMKSYGRAPTFLMATGYEQVRSIVAYLTGDYESAKKVELDLPETGVCSVNITPKKQEQSCCKTTSTS